MKEYWAPSSNRMCPSTEVYPAGTLAIAVFFNKHTLVEITEIDIVAAAVGVSSLRVIALTV